MVSGGRGCGCCRWHCCQTAAWQLACLMWKESASFVGGRISGINYGLCDSWLTGPCWQCLTFAHCILQMKSSASQEDHLFSVISADPSTAEKHSSKIPCQGVELHPVRAWNPARNFWSWSLSMSEWSTVVWVGTCYLLIQIFWHFILSKCTSCNTATSVSCETKQKLLDYLLEEHLRICLLTRGLQMACVCIWVGRLNFSGIAETATS